MTARCSWRGGLVDPVLRKRNGKALRRRLNAIKRTGFYWLRELTKKGPQMAILQLGRAIAAMGCGAMRRQRIYKAAWLDLEHGLPAAGTEPRA